MDFFKEGVYAADMKKILFQSHFLLFVTLIFSTPCFAVGGPETHKTPETGPKGKFEGAGHEMKEGFQSAGEGIKEGGKKTGRAIKKGGKAAGRGFKKAGHEIKEAFTE